MDPITKYCCGECGRRHKHYLSAEGCCRPEVFAVHICKHCEEEYEEHEEELAENCCADADPDELHRPDPAELEAAGQLRIAI